MNVQLEFTPSDSGASAAVTALEAAITIDIANYNNGPGIFSNIAGRKISVDTAIADFQAYAQEDVSLADLTIPLPAQLSDIVSRLRRYGVVVLPGVFSGEVLETLRNEFDALTSSPEEMKAKKFAVVADDNNVCIRAMRSNLSAEMAPETGAFYNAGVLSMIAESYYGHSAFALNNQIFVHKTLPTDAPLSGDLHFDVSRMLKFWIYLDEGREEAGAIRMAPGTSLVMGKIREEFSDRLIPKMDIFNQVDEQRHPAIPIEAPEGSLVIFDTDVAHGAGRVAPGQVRRIMRGHTMETKYLERVKKRG